MRCLACFFLFFLSLSADPAVKLGIDRFFEQGFAHNLQGKKIALVLNHTSYNSELEETYELFRRDKSGFKIAALFCPEHGITGAFHADESVAHSKNREGLPIYSLHGATKRPTEIMLKGIDVIIFDIQEVGVRSYTYATTLYYVMEEAARRKIQVIVLDRPNPMGGVIVDGPMLKSEWKSFIGYVNVPYCHGMTIGELARFFNKEKNVGCNLLVVPMAGWRRGMGFRQTGLQWIPASPNIPEADTPYFYASTGLLSGLGLVNTGIGHTQPFKVVGAPWIEATAFAKRLNGQKLPGVKFVAYHFKPFYGLYRNQVCQGVKILITNPNIYHPVAVQYTILGTLKSLYPEKVLSAIASLTEAKRKSFCRANGTDAVLRLLSEEKYPAWKLLKLDEKERKEFLGKRKPYLIY